MARAASARPKPRGLPGVRQLDEGWELASCAPDACVDPVAAGELEWLPATVPGTVAGALGREALGDRDPDTEDWWFRTSFEAESAADGEEVLLRLDGLATIAEVHLNGKLILQSDSMFVAQEVEVGALLSGANELAIRFRALTPLLQPKRKPRARWRTKVVPNGNLRFFRASIFGRAPGFSPGPAPVGPWRAISIERRTSLVVEEMRLRTRLEGADGVLTARVVLRAPGGEIPEDIELHLQGPSGEHRLTLGPADEDGVAGGELRIPEVERWWPHTHGEPALHDVWLQIGGGTPIDAGRVGFRSIAPGPTPDHDALEDGLDIHVNGEAIFARGAVWTPVDAIGLAAGGSRAPRRARAGPGRRDEHPAHPRHRRLRVRRIP